MNRYLTQIRGTDGRAALPWIVKAESPLEAAKKRFGDCIVSNGRVIQSGHFVGWVVWTGE